MVAELEAGEMFIVNRGREMRGTEGEGDKKKSLTAVINTALTSHNL